MYAQPDEHQSDHRIVVSEGLKAYIQKRNTDFRVCTSCGGPVLLPVSIKPPKSTDTEIYVGDHIVYVSIFQARFLDRIDMDIVPTFSNYIG